MSIACLLIVVEFREKTGVGNGVMDTEISSLATYLVYFIVWRENLGIFQKPL